MQHDVPNTIEAIRSRRAEVDALLRHLQREVAELETAEKVLARLSRSEALSLDILREPARLAFEDRRADKQSKANAASQRAQVLEALRECSHSWMDVGEIIEAVRQRHDRVLPRRSISPLLTNLKLTGEIVRDGRRVAAVERVAPQARSSSGQR